MQGASGDEQKKVAIQGDTGAIDCEAETVPG